MVGRAAEKLMTAEEFARLPEPEGGCQMELVRGVVVMAPPPGGGHGKRANRISVPLTLFAARNNLGEVLPEVGFRLRRRPDDVRAPDSSFVAFDRLPDGRVPEGYIEGAPTLAVEVISPANRQRQVLEKVGNYIDAGADRVWVVRESNHTVTVYFGPGGDAVTLRTGDTLTSEHAGFAVAGFALLVDEIFA
jgi:Uma2 family endonuclease